MRMDNFFFTIVSPEEINRPKPSRVQRLERACANCRKSKKRCGSERPCQRCVRTGRGDCCSSESPSSSSDLLPLDVTLPTVETSFTKQHDHHDHDHHHHDHTGHSHFEHHERSSIVFGMSPFYTPSSSSGPSSPTSSLCGSGFSSPSFNPSSFSSSSSSSFMTRPVSSLSSVTSLLNAPATPYDTLSNSSSYNYGYTNDNGYSTSSSSTSLRCSTGETFSVDIDSILATTDKKKEAAGLDQTTSASSSSFTSTPSTFCEIHDSVSPSSPFAASSRSHFASSSLSYSVASLGSTSLSVTSASSILTTSPVCSPSAASTCSMFTSFSNVAFSNSFSTSSSSN